MKTIDMSEKAILRRLKQVDQLRDLCLLLMKAKHISDKKSAEDRANLRRKNIELESKNTKVIFKP